MLRIGGGIDRVDTSFYPGHCIHERGLIAPDRVIIVEKLDRCLEHRSYVVLFCVHWDLSSLVFVFGSGEIPPSPTLAFSLDVRGAFRATSGALLATSGVLLVTAGVLLATSGIVLATADLPLATAGILLGTADMLLATADLPLATADLLLATAGLPLAVADVVLATAGRLFTREKALLPRSNRRKPLTNSKPAAPLYLSEDWFELTVSFPQLVPESEDRCGFDPKLDRVATAPEWQCRVSAAGA